MKVRGRNLLIGAFAASALVVASPGAHAARPTTSPPVVVAVVGEVGGVNVLHRDFRTADGRTPNYPRSMPRPVMISLPRSGLFAQAHAQLEAGPLGRMTPGVLYGVAGTRLLLVNAGDGPYDALQSAALHATGVADSITGTRYGTDPEALVVVVLTANQDRTYSWLADNAWVDLASSSSYAIRTTSDPEQCIGASDVRRFTAAGHLLFSSAGNTTDEIEPLMGPHGLPETYVVGGVDSSGKTWLPGHPEESDPSWAAGNVMRPYETGERYSYPAAAPDSFTGTTHFGGTSGATPLTAGWAARLVAHARHDLRSTLGTSQGALALGAGRVLRGPLHDGRFTQAELRTLLHDVAVQHSGAPPGAAYPLEGYGALDATSIHHAEQVLDGTLAQPTRTEDDEVDNAVLQARTAIFARCN